MEELEDTVGECVLKLGMGILKMKKVFFRARPHLSALISSTFEPRMSANIDVNLFNCSRRVFEADGSEPIQR